MLDPFGILGTSNGSWQRYPSTESFCPSQEVIWLSLELFNDPSVQFDWLVIIDLALGLSCEGSYVNISTIKSVSYKSQESTPLLFPCFLRILLMFVFFISSFIPHGEGSNLTEMLVVCGSLLKPFNRGNHFIAQSIDDVYHH